MNSELFNNGNRSLAALGYYMPAEWMPHFGTWLSYPHNPKSFFDKLAEAQEAFVEMVYWLADSEYVYINVNDERMHQDLVVKLKKRGVTERNVIIQQFPTDDAWCRDHGAIFLLHSRTQKLCATNWIFNAWGGKYPCSRDNAIPAKMAEFLACPCMARAHVLEGGSIDINDQGIILTTESCLLNPNRNPSLDKEAVERMLCDNLGAQKIVWLKDGIVGDDTDGHIDDISRFVNRSTIVTMVEKKQTDENYEPLQQNLEILRNATNMDNEPFTIHTLPMPDPMYYDDERLPASYANFYIANKVVLVPTFGCAQDAEALGTLQGLFPTRKVVGIDATGLIVGLGTFHCLSQQVPASCDRV